MGDTAAQLEKKVVEMTNLPTLPGVVRHISRMVEDKKSTASDVGEMITRDQALSARLLRLVNSPVYGFPGRISTVTHALVLLGFNVVKGLVLGTTVFDTFGARTKGLWEHSLGCALTSRELARVLGLADVEEVMIAGLLHDLGKAVLSTITEADYETAMTAAQERNCHIGVVEHEVFGVDHARVASWLAREWHLPARLQEPLTYHHRPELAKCHKDVTAIVHLADVLTRGMGYGNPGDMSMPPLNHDAFRDLHLSFAQIDQVIEQTEIEFAAGNDLFGVE